MCVHHTIHEIFFETKFEVEIRRFTQIGSIAVPVDGKMSQHSCESIHKAAFVQTFQIRRM